MKKRILSMLLALTMMVGMVPVYAITANAATVLTITQPSNWQFISKSNPPDLKWNTITGAAGYRVTVKNDATGVYYTQNEWTRRTSYSLENLFDEELGSNEYPRLKIWVGAMASKNDDPGLTSISNTSIIAVVSEAPDITNDGSSNITSDGAALKMTVKRNYSSKIADAGFYIGTSSSRSKAEKYSFDDYGPSSVVDSGTMTMDVTGLKSDTKYYYWAYAENDVDETTSTYKTFRTEEAAGTLSLSKTSINWAYGADNEENVTVAYNGSYSYSIEYDVPADIKNSDFNYEWLKVEKSGSKLNIRPDRANYAAAARSATITVTSNGQSKDITVTQAKCGEAAPALTLSRGNVVYSNGGVIGSYDLPQEYMEVSVSAKNIRKLTAYLGPVTGGIIATCTATDHISFDISDLSAGEYMISIYASNSNTANDYWSQRPFANGAFTLYFTLNGNGTSKKTFGNIADVKDLIVYTYSTDWSQIGKIAYVEQKFTGGNSKYYYTDYWGSLGGKELCTRAASAMAMSYIGKTAFPKYIAPQKKENESIVYDESIGVASPYTNYASAYSCDVKSYAAPSLNDFVNMYNQYANDTVGKYSPIVLHTGRSGSPHAVLIIGKDSSQNNVYWTVDSGMNEVGIGQIKLAEKDGKLVVEEYYYYATSKGVFKLDTRYGSSYSLCNPGIWQYVAKSSSSSQTYTITYNYNYNGGPIKTETKNHGETYTISKTITPTRPSTETSTTITSYEFYGWATSENGVVTYQPGDAYTQNSNLTLYAQWIASIFIKQQADTTVYSVSYDANGGKNAPDPSKGVKSGTTITLSTAKPTRSGYTFLGWSLDKNDAAADYQPGDSYTVTGAITLYAVWYKKSSGGGSSGGESTQTYTISGEIASYPSSGNYSIILYDADGEKYSVMVSRTPDYEFDVPAGTYTLCVTKADHSPYRSTITVKRNTVLPQVQLYLLGDANHDGKADSSDAVAILRNLAGYEVPVFYEDTADFNGDGKADSSDAVAILRKLAGY
ncbi:MAG: InlB B-repeat-containing protein [Clostridia bacterium]|nr:InlB B-repeat-containing protein [Clostridia bacterium]